MISQQEWMIRLRNKQRNQSRKAANQTFQQRIQRLSQLKKLLVENEDSWLAALRQDLNKPPVEAYASEIGVLLNEIDFIEKRLNSWLKVKKKRRLLFTGYEKNEISRRPYGSILVLSPWNYPLQLALMPVIGALAAGNSVVLKPSEYASATSGLLAELVPLYFKESVFAVIEGDYKVAEQLTAIEWDFIFFTGSKSTGQKVYEAASKNLTPVLLELGGKNPCIVDETGMNEETIKQIVWGKFLNAGQSCIAPDTVYVDRKIYPEFLEKVTKQIETFYGENPLESPDYGRIIHEKQFNRTMGFMKDGHVYYGGQSSEEKRYISPTVLIDIPPESAAATEEIFGPVLPIVPYDSLDDLLTQLEHLSVPLVTYVFSQNDENVQQINHKIESGALSHGQVIVHAASPHLPFGGKGASGFGRYHGEASFKSFSYEKSMYSKKSFFSLNSQYPPYTKKALQALRKFRKRLF